MRTRPDRRSPWGQRVWLDEQEFEDIMDEIRVRAGATSFAEGDGIDVDEILLRVYGLLLSVSTLSEGESPVP